MARVPEFTQRIFADRSNAGNIAAAGAAYGGNEAQQLTINAQQAQRSAQRVGEFGDDVAKQRAVQGQLKAQARFNDFQRNKTKWYQDQQNTRMTTPDGFARGFDDWMAASQTEIEDEIANRENKDEPFDIDYFRSLMDRERTQTFENANNWENSMRIENVAVGTERNLDNMNANFSLSRPRFSDLPAQFDSVRTYVNTTGSKVLSPQQNFKLAKYGMNQAAGAVMDTMLEDDPYAARDVLLYGQGTNDQVIDYIMDVVEGGDKVVAEPNGGIAKFGINSVANGMTEEQVKALTRDQAREIYKSKYALDARLDKFTPAFKVIAQDAIVNHGNDKTTWKMINQAKGDPYALIQIRREYYDSLIEGDPEKYSKYAAGWDNRLQTVSMYARNMEGGRGFLDMAGMIDPDIITRAQASVPASVAAKDREKAAELQKKLTEFNTSYKNIYDAVTTEIEPVGMDEINTLKDQAYATQDQKAIASAQALEQIGPFVSSLKGMGEDQLRKTIRGLSAENNKAPSDAGRLKIELAEGVLAKQITAIKNEGLAYYGRTGQARMPQPVNYGDVFAAADELRSREDSALNIFQRTGKLMPVLTPDEITELQETFKTAPANVFARQLAAFDNLDPKSKELVAEKIAEKEPAFGVAISVDSYDVRAAILQGTKLEANYKADDMTAAIDTVTNDMDLDPVQKQMASKAIEAYYKTRSQALNKGTGVDAIVESDIVEEATKAIFGDIYEINNGSRVFTFNDPRTQEPVDEDTLYDMFNGMTDADLVSMFGKPPKDILGNIITAEDIKQDGKLVSAGDGLYLIKFPEIGIVPAVDDPLNPLVIDGRRLLLDRKKRG